MGWFLVGVVGGAFFGHLLGAAVVRGRRFPAWLWLAAVGALLAPWAVV